MHVCFIDTEHGSERGCTGLEESMQAMPCCQLIPCILCCLCSGCGPWVQHQTAADLPAGLAAAGTHAGRGCTPLEAPAGGDHQGCLPGMEDSGTGTSTLAQGMSEFLMCLPALCLPCKWDLGAIHKLCRLTDCESLDTQGPVMHHSPR